MNHKYYKIIFIILKYLISKHKLKIAYCLNYYLMLDMYFIKEVMLAFAISFKLKATLA